MEWKVVSLPCTIMFLLQCLVSSYLVVTSFGWFQLLLLVTCLLVAVSAALFFDVGSNDPETVFYMKIYKLCRWVEKYFAGSYKAAATATRSTIAHSPSSCTFKRCYVLKASSCKQNLEKASVCQWCFSLASNQWWSKPFKRPMLITPTELILVPARNWAQQTSI